MSEPAIEPLAVADNPWVKVLTALQAKIANADLSFSKFCFTNFGRVPKVFARFGTENNAAYWDPPLTDCPSVLISCVNAPLPEDHGAGNEQSTISFQVSAKYELKTRDSRLAIAANYELLRTIMHCSGTGTLDTLRIAGVAKYVPFGDMTPNIAMAGSQTTARTTFAVQFVVIVNFFRRA